MLFIYVLILNPFGLVILPFSLVYFCWEMALASYYIYLSLIYYLWIPDFRQRSLAFCATTNQAGHFTSLSPFPLLFSTTNELLKFIGRHFPSSFLACRSFLGKKRREDQHWPNGR
jgi:hypothetical protein